MITTANKAWPDLKSASVTLHRRQTFRRIQQSCKRQLISNTLMSNTNTNTSKSDQLTELQSCKLLQISNTMTIDHAEMNNISPGIIFQNEFHKYQHFHIKPIPQMSENMECWQLLDIYPARARSYGKNRIFGPKTEILGPKKGDHFCTLTMFWPRPEKVVQRKKVPLPK